MSYEIVKSAKLTDDGITVNCASNNVTPRIYSDASYKSDTFEERLKDFFTDIRERNIQFTPKANISINLKENGTMKALMPSSTLMSFMESLDKLHPNTTWELDWNYNLNRTGEINNIIYEQFFKPYMTSGNFDNMQVRQSIKEFDSHSADAYKSRYEQLRSEDKTLIQHALSLHSMFADKVLLMNDTEDKLYITSNDNYKTRGTLENVSKAICLDEGKDYQGVDVWRVISSLENVATDKEFKYVRMYGVDNAEKVLADIQKQAETLGYNDIVAKTKELSMLIDCFGREGEQTIEGEGIPFSPSNDEIDLSDMER